MQSPDTENIVFEQAVNFIKYTNHPVFLTGKAGTGKTTFLKFIKEACNKNMAVVAPTGVAAINAGGTTIHSFFQLPFSPFLPAGNRVFNGGAAQVSDEHDLLGKLKLTNEMRELMQGLELLIIDEISMVRCDVLDAIDTVLKYVRNNHSQPFGGIQVLYIGDLYQLPPVIKDEEWKILQACYENQYFFSSRVMISQPPVYIELEKVYRQTDPGFIHLLNKVRNNEMTEPDFVKLHTRFFPSSEHHIKDGFITLTTHNAKANTINSNELAMIPGKDFSFQAEVSGDFNEKNFPADENLQLKIGAQVMFIKNDAEKVRRYFNGKIGRVNKIEEGKIWVECKSVDSTDLVEVKKETWRNIKYSLNDSRQVEEKELGSFVQYPLRLAWAITIHKSQGLTFEKAIIDAGSAFAPGQVYVALSRCTSLEGIVLQSKISNRSLHSDERIVIFCTQQSKRKHEEIFAIATKTYEEESLKQIFGLRTSEVLLNLFIDTAKGNQLGKGIEGWCKELKSQVSLCVGHSIRFIAILNQHFSNHHFITDSFIQDRIIKASEWFSTQLNNIKEFILTSPALTDNRQSAKDYNSRLNNLFNNVCFHIHILGCCTDGFSMEKYGKKKSTFVVGEFTPNAYAGGSQYISKDILHPSLFMALKEKRDNLGREKNLPLYLICNSFSLEQMANYLPKTTGELKNIHGFGKIKVNQFGNEFLPIIRGYCELHNLTSSSPPEIIKKTRRLKPKGDKIPSNKITYDYFKEGKTLSEISVIRNFAISTIEGHITFFIGNGEINIDELVDETKQSEILNAISKIGDKPLSVLKEALPSVSFSELRWVLTAKKAREGSLN